MSAEEEEYVPFSKRPEWADVKGVPQDDGPDPACPILYDPEFVDAMDYFRAVVQRNELSERALDLTGEVISHNAANYTVWFFRRRILEALQNKWAIELEFVSHIISANPKNYQVWHHRQAVVEALKDGSKECEFTSRILDIDAKNYHAWQHRHWAMMHFDLFKTVPNNGLDEVERLLSQDPRNNSAWNHRYFIHTHNGGFSVNVAHAEVSYALDHLRRAPANESAWNYIRGVCKAAGVTLGSVPQIKEVCDHLISEEGDVDPQVLSILVDLHEQAASADGAADDQVQKAKTAAAKLCATLKDRDAVRAKYWDFRQRCITAQ